MGLDSVELLMEWENYFGIQIPDPMAQEMYTVQQAVEGIAQLLHVEKKDGDLEEKLYEHINKVLTDMGKGSVQLNEPIFQILSPQNKEQWAVFSQKMALNVPLPRLGKEGNSILSNVYSFLSSPAYRWQTVTLKECIAVIAAANHAQLIRSISIQSHYEIYIALIALMADTCGVDYYEVQPHKRFASDFGID